MCLKTEWWEFHKKNPRVYDLFERFTLAVINRGFQHYSAKAIFERIRWHTDVETSDAKFKLQNNHTAYYSRYFMHRHPDHDGFFRTRETQTEI